MRIIFMGTPEFSVPVLAQLLASDHQVVAVYTQPDRPRGRGRKPLPSPVKQEALEHGLDIHQPANLREMVAVEHLASLEPDIIIVASFGQILPQQVLDIPASGCLNVHPSLLPKYRGPSPISSAILAGDEETGVTIMLMDTSLDTGPILTQSRVAIEPQDTTGSLTSRLSHVGAKLIIETIPRWINQQLRPRTQDEHVATYTHTVSKQDGKINWHLSAIEIWRRVRAFHPWPGCYTSWHSKILKIIEAIPIKLATAKLKPGSVVSLDPEFGASVGVVTGEGILGLCKLQLEGRRPLAGAEFLRGQRDIIGTSLGE